MNICFQHIAGVRCCWAIPMGFRSCYESRIVSIFYKIDNVVFVLRNSNFNPLLFNIVYELLFFK